MLRGDEVYGPKNSLNDYFVNFTVYLCANLSFDSKLKLKNAQKIVLKYLRFQSPDKAKIGPIIILRAEVS